MRASAFVRNTEQSIDRLRDLASWRNLDADDLLSGIRFIEGDITDLGDLEDALVGIDTVIHAAALISVKKSEADNMLKINGEGTANVINLSLELGIKRFIHISSIATLGPHPEGLVDEDYFFKNGPEVSSYALSKYAAEQEVWRGAEEGLNVVIVNPGFVIGPSRNTQGSAALFYALRDGLPGYVSGASGYVDVRDVADVIVHLIDHSVNNKRFILSAKNLSNLEFIRLIAEAMGQKVPTRKIGSMYFPFLILGSRLLSIFRPNRVPLTRDSLKMAHSKQAFDGSRIQEILPEFRYRDIPLAIQETAAIIKTIK